MLGLMADEALVSNPQRIIDGFELELAELEQRFLPRLGLNDNNLLGADPAASLLVDSVQDSSVPVNGAAANSALGSSAAQGAAINGSATPAASAETEG